MFYSASRFFVAFGVVSSFRCFVVYLTTKDISDSNYHLNFAEFILLLIPTTSPSYCHVMHTQLSYIFTFTLVLSCIKAGEMEELMKINLGIILHINPTFIMSSINFTIIYNNLNKVTKGWQYVYLWWKNLVNITVLRFKQCHKDAVWAINGTAEPSQHISQ